MGKLKRALFTEEQIRKLEATPAALTWMPSIRSLSTA